MNKKIIIFLFLATMAVAYQEENLVSRWMLEDGAGAVARDVSALNNGTIDGGVWVEGKSGGGLFFIKGDSILCGDNASLQFTSSFTIMCWIKLDNQTYQVLLGSVKSDTSKGYQLRIWGPNPQTGRMASFMPGGGGWHWSDTPVTINVWHHVAWTWDTHITRFYLDGEPDGSSATTNTLEATGAGTEFRMGNSSFDGSDLDDGVMDDTRAYNIDLPAARIKAIYLSTFRRHVAD